MDADLLKTYLKQQRILEEKEGKNNNSNSDVYRLLDTYYNQLKILNEPIQVN